MGRPYLGTKPFVLRVLPFERQIWERVAAARHARTVQAWALNVLNETADAEARKLPDPGLVEEAANATKARKRARRKGGA